MIFELPEAAKTSNPLWEKRAGRNGDTAITATTARPHFSETACPAHPYKKQLLGQAAQHHGKLIAIGVRCWVLCGMFVLSLMVAFSYASISILGRGFDGGPFFMAPTPFRPKDGVSFFDSVRCAALYIGIWAFYLGGPVEPLAD